MVAQHLSVGPGSGRRRRRGCGHCRTCRPADQSNLRCLETRHRSGRIHETGRPFSRRHPGQEYPHRQRPHARRRRGSGDGKSRHHAGNRPALEHHLPAQYPRNPLGGGRMGRRSGQGLVQFPERLQRQVGGGRGTQPPDQPCPFLHPWHGLRSRGQEQRHVCGGRRGHVEGRRRTGGAGGPYPPRQHAFQHPPVLGQIGHQAGR